MTRPPVVPALVGPVLVTDMPVPHEDLEMARLPRAGQEMT